MYAYNYRVGEFLQYNQNICMINTIFKGTYRIVSGYNISMYWFCISNVHGLTRTSTHSDANDPSIKDLKHIPDLSNIGKY